ncbi:hypothetical protein SAMN05216344_106120 [Polaromonas sp. OV174]|uniref:phage gp6-like head-tail connector protein n=1 Tax=Polaromonas sp. OV174 TaxID=1855300 RepID=UPI0008E3894A|nr:phage gp6-like head-tail connector protein [Polaromonas sp. OV174]SFB96589.1 hypothetical protein SAMN05216344_106120 [Polaromonas sp. OV174]
MPIKPTVEEAQRRLRIDADLAADLESAIDQAHAEALAFLDLSLYADDAALAAAADASGIVATADIIAAQLLLTDALVGNNSLQDRESKREAARNMLRPHRRMGV